MHLYCLDLFSSLPICALPNPNPNPIKIHLSYKSRDRDICKVKDISTNPLALVSQSNSTFGLTD